MASPEARRIQRLAASNSGGGGTSSAEISHEVVAEIVAGCQEGDAAAQRRLYELTHQNVFRLMVRMVGEQDAADATQQAFLQVFRGINQFTGKSQITTWIYRVAVNEALQLLRRSKRERPERLELDPIDRSPESRENLDDKELLERAIELLDPDLRTAFLLREIEGLSYGEIAAVLEVPEGTVGSRLNRARQELKQRLVELGWER